MHPPSGKPWLVLSARSSGVGNGSVRVGPMSGDPENRSESGSEEGEHQQRQPANGIKNQRITKAQDRILNRMAKSTKRMPLPPPIRDSIASIKVRKPSGLQSEALREAVSAVLRKSSKGGVANLSDVAEALEEEYASRGRRPDELTATLNELTQLPLFMPDLAPAEFFARSWIIKFPQDGSTKMRRLIINLTLDALDRWINSQPDAPTDNQGVRALRHVTMLDEAHVVLSTKLPALGNLVRMSRSKGGSVMLVSQSPDDFENTEDGYLDNMGMTLAFNTQAKLGPTKRIFGDSLALASLQVGEAVRRIRLEARTQKILCWNRECTGSCFCRSGLILHGN